MKSNWGRPSGDQLRRGLVVLLAIWLLGTVPLRACGPFFPNTVLDSPEHGLRAPTFTFALADVLPTNSAWRARTDRAALAHQDPVYGQGRALLGVDDAAAIQCFRKVRAQFAVPAQDTNGLGAASLGWEARAELNCGQLIRAGELYIEQYATGDPTALMSLRIVAAKLLAADAQTLRAAARHRQLSRVITLYLAARGGPFWPAPPPEQTQRWLAAVEATGTVNLDCADWLAWAAYHNGQFDLAQRWLPRAAQPSASTGWLRTKLLLRDGQAAEATRVLAATIRRFPQTNDWPQATKYQGDVTEPDSALDQARGELATLQLSRRAYAEALHLLLQAGYWMDAAYVAERVMSIEELLAYTKGSRHTDLRHLLARRLIRLGRHAQARPFLPEPVQPKLDQFTAGLHQADAEGLWQAAQLLRWYGLALAGTELAPDWHVHGGQYDWGFAAGSNQVPVQADVQPPQRFHYRYRAAELAWQAANLLPDNQDRTARVLCEAGSWLKDRDPKAADRFYKALVRRCGQTPLGQEADRRRWFPPLAPEKAD